MLSLKEQLANKLHYSYRSYQQNNGRYAATVKCNGKVVDTIEERLTLDSVHSIVREYYPTARYMNGALIEVVMQYDERLANELEVFRSNLQNALSSASILKQCDWPHAEQAQSALAGLIRFVEIEQMHLQK